MKEQWKDIAEYEGLYQISNLGRVKSLERIVERQNNHNLYVSEKILKNGICSNGYKYARLYKNGNVKHKLVHRLVATAFAENKENLPFVNHKDETRDNNTIENLEWCTREYNMNYGTTGERISEKLSKAVCQYDKNNNFLKRFKSATDIEKQLRYYPGNICNCCQGKGKTAYGYIWGYANSN